MNRSHFRFAWRILFGLMLSAGVVMRAPTVAIAADTVVHWTNSTAQNGGTVLGSGATFTTDFKGASDVQVTKLSGAVSSTFIDDFGGATPGNNPAWITTFVGSTAQGTGDGTIGHWRMLETSSTATVLSFDFAIPLLAGDRMLIVDVDNSESYQVQAYAKVGSDYIAESLAGWVHQSFSGQAGITPDSRWATWNPDGHLTATTSGLNEPLDVLVLDQRTDRILFTKFSGGSGTPGVQFAAATSAVPGDYNGNGVVDAADYAVWRKGGTLANEVDAPGTVNAADYTAWRARYGNQVSGNGAGAASGDPPAARAVPEPGAVLLGLTALVATVLPRGRRRHLRCEARHNGRFLGEVKRYGTIGCAGFSLFVLTSEVLQARDVARNEGPANDATRSVHEEATRILNSVKLTEYRHKTDIDEKKGAYYCDCSGFVGYVLNRTVAKETGKGPFGDGRKRPLAMDYEKGFAKTPDTTDGKGGWRQVARVADARPGDVIAWRHEVPKPGNTGHVVIVDQAPVVEKDGLISVGIMDSTTLPSNDVTKDKGKSGIGRRTMWFKVDKDGKAIGYVRGSRTSRVKLEEISVGRALPATAAASEKPKTNRRAA